eukprot:2512863-Alexandrium_andersonii.AAC.1
MGPRSTRSTHSQLCATSAGAAPGEARKSTSAEYDSPGRLDATSKVPGRRALRTVDTSSAAARCFRVAAQTSAFDNHGSSGSDNNSNAASRLLLEGL